MEEIKMNWCKMAKNNRIMANYQQLATLLIDLKLSSFITANDQLGLVHKASKLLESRTLGNAGNNQLIAALEQIQECHRIPLDIRSEAKRIIESWVPF